MAPTGFWPHTSTVSESPRFGQADLSNCERELIHLTGSVQPHGLLLLVEEPGGAVMQVSANAATLLGLPVERLLKSRLAHFGGTLADQVRAAAEGELCEPAPLRCLTHTEGAERRWEGAVHRVAGTGLVIELEPLPPPGHDIETVDIEESTLMALVAQALDRLGGAPSVGALADAAATCFRELTGYDRVMVYKFDADGHGKIIAEARHPCLDSLLGHHYPATDIPQRARELYVRNRVRVLVDVHYQPSPLLCADAAASPTDLDLSMSYLRSMSPLHLQYLKNMGVTGTLVVSLVREGRLWGLVAAHHYSPRNLRLAVRATADLLAEVISTRIAAIENYAHAQVAVMVRRLEQRLVDATSNEGDWRLALFRNPRTLLQPLEATGAALFSDGEILPSGEVPSTPELRELLRWVDSQYTEAPFACNAVARANPALASLSPLASGVLAVRLSASQPDYLMWFRKEQLLTVTWAGDPSKPMVNDNPLELSPRRSFAAWSEIVRGTALPWTSAELALGRAIGAALVDIILQVHAVRLLIAEHQLASVREKMQDSLEPVLLTDGQGRPLFTNAAFTALSGATAASLGSAAGLAALFTEPDALSRAMLGLRHESPTWRGELALARGPEPGLPVALRAERVHGRDGTLLGVILIFTDQREVRRAAAARQQLERALSLAAEGRRWSEAPAAAPHEIDAVIGAILTNASVAAMDIADGAASGPVAHLLQELEASTRRATALYGRIRELSSRR